MVFNTEGFFFPSGIRMTLFGFSCPSPRPALTNLRSIMKQEIRFYLWRELGNKKWNKYSDDEIIKTLKRKYTRRFLDDMVLFEEVLGEIKRALIGNRKLVERLKGLMI